MITLVQLSKNLKQIREELEYSQSEICAKSGIHQPTLSNIENGKNFKIEAFLLLYNFYCQELDSNIVISKLFNVKDAYTEVLIEKLTILSDKTGAEIQKIIKTLQ